MYAAIDFPGAAATRARGINNRGDIVGEYDDIDGSTHGFVLLQRGKKSIALPVDYPDAVATYAEGINEHGDIAGAYLDDSNQLHGFADEDGDFSTIEVPGSTWTGANGINDKGVIVGAYQTDIDHGFTVYKDKLDLLDHPDGEYGTSCIGINSHGDIVGWYGVTSGEHGFLLHKGEYSNIDAPDARSTYAWGINGRRDIVGVFVDDLGNQHGFLARAK